MCSITDDYSDLVELGIDIHNSDILTNKFNKCVKHIQSIAGTLDNQTLLRLYAFYKQSNDGPCNTPKPSWYDMRGKAKWEAWNDLAKMPKNEAKHKYIELVSEVSPTLSFDEAENKSESWVKVSSLVPEEPVGTNKDISDYIRSGDCENVKAFLQLNSNCINDLDANGIGLMHYASDIGSIIMLKLLVKEGLNVNLQDSEGQTPLHYAASCGHGDCIEFLLSNGAKKDITDSEGNTAADVACDDSLKKLLI